jgi:DnaK suppressor protein
MSIARPLGLSRRELGVLRRRLLDEKQALLGQLATRGEEAGAAAEARYPELVGRSQHDAARAMAARLGEEEFARLRRIEGALHRMVLDTYGICTRSGGPVGLERLRTDPAAALCPDCAAAEERQPRGGSVRDERDDHAADVPAEFAELEDAEIASLVHERFRQEVGPDLDDTRIACRHGLVTLGGDVPSEELRSVALHIVEDEMGLDVVDRLRVDALEGELGSAPAATLGDATDLLDLSDGCGITADVFASDEDGLAWTPPSRPVPDSD